MMGESPHHVYTMSSSFFNDGICSHLCYPVFGGAVSFFFKNIIGTLEYLLSLLFMAENSG